MSYIVPRDKPTECRRCPFCHGRTYDCRLQRESDEKSFDDQFRTCPLETCNDYDNKVNLCDSCRKHYPDCDANKSVIILGTGEGNDNVCACSKYSPWYAPKSRRTFDGDTPWRRLNGIIFDINPTEIADQITRDNLGSWCYTIQTEMAMCLTTMKVDEEELT